MIIIRSRHQSHRNLRRAKVKSNYNRVVYRLGSTHQGRYDKEINSVESILNSSSKLRMKRCFDKGLVKTTQYWTDYKDIPIDNEETFPIVAKIINGSRGRGMVKIDNKEQFENFIRNRYHKGYYFEKYFNSAKEYRVHYHVGTGAFYSLRKLREEGAKDRWYFNSNNCVWINEFEPIRDNNGRFVKFSEKRQDLFDIPANWNDIINEVGKAVKAVGLDIAAVDVRVKKNGEFVILETNSAPGLAEIGQALYLNLLKQIGRSYKRKR